MEFKATVSKAQKMPRHETSSDLALSEGIFVLSMPVLSVRISLIRE